jgi:NDP-sugar pyrophosphorylase family protein
MVGDSTKVGERTAIKKSVIGKHCTIGKMVKIAGCVILDHCVIEDGQVQCYDEIVTAHSHRVREQGKVGELPPWT